jgi:predicted nucleic acid-binding protein
VLSEYLNVVKRRLNLPKQDILMICRQNIDVCRLVAVEKNTLVLAEQLILRYDFQMFDSIIVATALENGCNILYSEDLHHNQLIEKKLKITNPFL